MHNKTNLSVAVNTQIHSVPIKEPYLAVVTSSPGTNRITVDEAAAYIADLLDSLQAMAVNADLDVLSDLIHVAKEEARLNCISA